jgi:N utilization substance protein A
VAVRHYFGQYEEGEERPVAVVAAADVAEPAHRDETAMNGAHGAEAHGEDGAEAEPILSDEAGTDGRAEDGAPSSMEKTPEEILVADAVAVGEVEEVRDLSTEDVAEAEEAGSVSDAYSDADAREEAIELENDSVDELVNESQEVSDEGIDNDGHDRG